MLSVKVASREVSQLSVSSVTSPVTALVVLVLQLTSTYRVISDGVVNVGLRVSNTAIVCVDVNRFPQSSDRDQVLVIVKASPQPGVNMSEYVASSEVSQLSVSSITSPDPVAEVSTMQAKSRYSIVSLGTVKEGRVVSVIWIVCSSDVEFPQSSVNVQVL